MFFPSDNLNGKKNENGVILFIKEITHTSKTIRDTEIVLRNYLTCSLMSNLNLRIYVFSPRQFKLYKK